MKKLLGMTLCTENRRNKIYNLPWRYMPNIIMHIAYYVIGRLFGRDNLRFLLNSLLCHYHGVHLRTTLTRDKT